MPRELVTVAGALAQRPGRGGHAWVFLQYLLGFRALGWDVHFIDRLDLGADPRCAEWLRDVMAAHGLAENWTLLAGDAVLGVPRPAARRRVRNSAFLLNVMGYLDDAELLAAAPRRVFLDIDPGFGQMWQALGFADVFAGHDAFATVGTRLGTPGCIVPTAGRAWIPTLPPVVLAEWPVAPPRSDAAITSVCSWRGPFGPIEYGGRTYGLRVHEFRRFLDIPARTGADVELALDIDTADAADRARLAAAGFRLIDPAQAAADPARYRAYVAGSAAELCVAKNLYVDTAGGWFSDRSACYLASGRPVIAQDTAATLPAGVGMLTFRTLDEAVDAVAEVRGHPARQARAARELAEAYLASDVVLPTLAEAVTA
jgi:hypothetical protein